MANWRDIGDTTKERFIAALKGTPLASSAEALWNVVRPHSRLFLAQAKIESNLAQDTLPAANNFLGQRPRDGSGGFVDFISYVACAQYWYGKITDPAWKYKDTTTVESYVHVYAPSSDGNNEAAYVRSILSYIETVPKTQSGVKTYSTSIPGLPGGPLLTTYPVYIKLVPEWRTLNRPGTKAKSPRRSIQHGNGNPNSSAAGEATYLFNGAEGRQASYHSTTDDKETWVMVPLDEISWQASDGFTGVGNNYGFSNEMIEDANLWASPARRDKVIANAADFMGRIAARLGATMPEQHWNFNFNDPNRHDCPNKLRHVRINGRLAWDIYAEKWQAARADELRRMNGTTTKYVAPNVPEWLVADLNDGIPGDHMLGSSPAYGMRRRVKAVRATGRFQTANRGAKRVGPDIAAGEEFEVCWWFKTTAGIWYLTPYATRVFAADTDFYPTGWKAATIAT